MVVERKTTALKPHIVAYIYIYIYIYREREREKEKEISVLEWFCLSSLVERNEHVYYKLVKKLVELWQTWDVDCIYIYIYIYIYVFCLFALLLFNGISTFVGYLMQNPSFKKNSSGII